MKLVWLQREKPAIVNGTYKFLHAADFLVGKLIGDFNCTDTSNALKSGVDLISGTWPEFIEKQLGLPLSKFPKIFRPGEKMGEAILVLIFGLVPSTFCGRADVRSPVSELEDREE